MKKKLKTFLKKYWPETVLFPAFLVFAAWLMWHTFGYKDGVILMAPKVWSDFSATLPLIRSFSWGSNWPPEYPLFPGEPIRYHFLFHFFVGMLERVGVRLDWALNLPSALGLFALMVLIYLLGKLLFKSRWVGLLGVVFLLFNGSLSFLEFFKLHPLSANTLTDIATNMAFPSFGPYDGKIVSAFWNLNIYTNQRHLAAAYAGVLLIIYLLTKAVIRKKAVSGKQVALMAGIFGLYPFFHKAMFPVIGLTLGWFWLVFPRIRRPVFWIGLVGGLLALPQVYYQMGDQLTQTGGQPAVLYNPGYLVDKPLTVKSFLEYWFYNLGLGMILIPLGLLLADKKIRKIFFIFVFSFLAGYLFQYTPDIAGNHKFFNFFILGGNLLAAFVIVKLWRKSWLGKLIAPLLVSAMILSGIIDFFPVANEKMGESLDIPGNPIVTWVRENTPRDAVFLNSSYFSPVSQAGRKVFLGWPYFVWSAGYDLEGERSRDYRMIYESNNKLEICRYLVENNIDYFDVQDTQGDPNLPNIDLDFFYNNFVPEFSVTTNRYALFETKKNCAK